MMESSQVRQPSSTARHYPYQSRRNFIFIEETGTDVPAWLQAFHG